MSEADGLSIPSIPRVIVPRGGKAIAPEGQCDCACPAPPVSPPPEPVSATRLVRNPALQLLPLGASCQVAFVPSGEHIAVLNSGARCILEAFARPVTCSSLSHGRQETWDDAFHRAVADLARLRFLVSPEAPAVQKPCDGAGTLVAWLHVTNSCGLRCRYCYLRKTDETMDFRVGRASIDAVFRSALAHGFAAIRLKYGGGEPTMNFPLVVALHRYAAERAAQYDKTLDGVVLSSGVGLTGSMAEAMLACNLRLMMSLDGVGRSHDDQRTSSDGKGTFQAVSRSLECVLAKGLTPDISITVSGRSICELPRLLEWVLERSLPFGLNFYRENALSAAETDLRLEEDCTVAGMLAAYEIVEAHLPRRSLTASLLDRSNLAVPHLRPCRVGHSYLVFDCRGRVAKCQMDIQNTVSDSHDPDPLTRIREDKGGVQNLTVDEKAECHDCLWRYWCAGGCPLQAYYTTGRYDGKSPNCRIYRALYPEVVRLEGLRLLAYGEEAA